MSEQTLTMQESHKLVGTIDDLAQISVVRFCGPERILTDEKTRVCVQVDIESFGDCCIIYLTQSQALKLAEEIQNVYRKAD